MFKMPLTLASLQGGDTSHVMRNNGAEVLAFDVHNHNQYSIRVHLDDTSEGDIESITGWPFDRSRVFNISEGLNVINYYESNKRRDELVIFRM